jgi:hypothetical protein
MKQLMITVYFKGEYIGILGSDIITMNGANQLLGAQTFVKWKVIDKQPSLNSTNWRRHVTFTSDIVDMPEELMYKR